MLGLEFVFFLPLEYTYDHLTLSSQSKRALERTLRSSSSRYLRYLSRPRPSIEAIDVNLSKPPQNSRIYDLPKHLPRSMESSEVWSEWALWRGENPRMPRWPLRPLRVCCWWRRWPPLSPRMRASARRAASAPTMTGRSTAPRGGWPTCQSRCRCGQSNCKDRRNRVELQSIPLIVSSVIVPNRI